jgi:hypothetical protein
MACRQLDYLHARHEQASARRAPYSAVQRSQKSLFKDIHDTSEHAPDFKTFDGASVDRSSQTRCVRSAVLHLRRH